MGEVVPAEFSALIDVAGGFFASLKEKEAT